MTIKDKKHWAHKSEASKDEVRDAIEQSVDWILEHRREAAFGAGGLVAVALIAGLFLYSRHARSNDAWDKLSQAELYAYSGRPADAQALLTQVVDGGGSAAATSLAHLMAGDLQYPSGKYAEALAAYDQALTTAPEPLRPFALAEKVATLEAMGKPAECAAAAQEFMTANPDHLLTAQVFTALARCQAASGKAEDAKATLQRIALQFKDTAWGQWAEYKLNNKTAK